MNTEIFKKQFSASSFFTLLFGITGWIALSALIFYTVLLIFTPAQFCGFYLHHDGSYYTIKMRWIYGQDSVAYRTYNGKEAIEVLKILNEQATPLKIQHPRPKNL